MTDIVTSIEQIITRDLRSIRNAEQLFPDKPTENQL